MKHRNILKRALNANAIFLAGVSIFCTAPLFLVLLKEADTLLPDARWAAIIWIIVFLTVTNIPLAIDKERILKWYRSEDTYRSPKYFKVSKRAEEILKSYEQERLRYDFERFTSRISFFPFNFLFP